MVFMDNVSTHMTADVEMAIAETGVIWIYGAPYSPHLSPIEIIFHFTKAYLKCNCPRMYDGMRKTVDKDVGIKYFKNAEILEQEQCLLKMNTFNL